MEIPTENVSLKISLDHDGHSAIEIYWANNDESTLANMATLLYEASHTLLTQPILDYLLKRGKDNEEEHNFIFRVLTVSAMLEQSDNTEDRLVVRPTEALNLRKTVINE